MDNTAAAVTMESVDTVNLSTAAAVSSIPMPDHEVRGERWFQIYVRLARPTLDWITDAAVLWAMILQPWVFGKFDIPEAGMALAWAGTVYGFKYAEKVKGVA